MIEGPLKADGRLAAKNATKIRAALTQVTNFKSVFNRYQETQPQPSKNRTQDRARARAWILLNVGFNNEALHNAIMHAWAEAYVLGEVAANVWIMQTRGVMKAPITGGVNWDTWKPGDRATALLVKPVGGFKRYLEQSGGASYFKKFDKETTEMLGTALADSIAAGLDSEAAALLMKDYVGSAGRALTIAITEQNRAMSFSTIQRYKEADLEKMEWHVSDPCDICRQNAGVVINIGSTFPSGDAQPPAHPHCRCVLLPVIPGMEEDTGVGGTITSPTMSPDGTLQTSTEEDYRMRHRAPSRADEFGSPATDIGREMMPGFYENPSVYSSGMSQADKESTRVLMSIKDKPEEMVTIYRAVPAGVDKINPGDWVTLSPSYAEQHLASNVEGGHVISMQIRAKDLWFDGDSINEFGYDPVSKAVNAVKELNDITPELKTMFKATGIGKFENPEIANQIEQMAATDIAKGSSRGDSQLEMIAKMQKFDGKPTVVPKVTDLMKMQDAGQGKILWRGITDYSHTAANAAQDLANPPVTYSAKQAVNDFISGPYRAGWGSFGSGTYATSEISEAKVYAQTYDQAEGKLGNGKVIGMFLPNTALMPTKEVIKQAMKETDAFEGSYNLGRALAAKGYQAYDVGLVQDNKTGYYVILDRSVLTVAEETR